MAVERLREEVLARAKAKAEKIIEEARREAEEIVRKAQEEYRRRLEEARREAYQRVVSEENERYIRRVMELNMEVLKEKNKMIKYIEEEAKKRLAELNPDERLSSLRALIQDALSTGIFGKKLRVRVRKADKELAMKALKDLGLEAEVISDLNGLGGVIVENEDSTTAVDNTYETRLEQAMKTIISKLNRLVFGE
jgi:vacuolar-type H+-ATPase subunit E/Vma4